MLNISVSIQNQHRLILFLIKASISFLKSRLFVNTKSIICSEGICVVVIICTPQDDPTAACTIDNFFVRFFMI